MRLAEEVLVDEGVHVRQEDAEPRSACEYQPTISSEAYARSISLWMWFQVSWVKVTWDPCSRACSPRNGCEDVDEVPPASSPR
jgi:hypothetical protein